MAKEYAKGFYNSKEWQKMRAYILMRDNYRCRLCGDTGALEVHHVQHITPANILNAGVTLNADNLITLCRDCHFKEHAKERTAADRAGDGFAFDENGFLIPV